MISSSHPPLAHYGKGSVIATADSDRQWHCDRMNGTRVTSNNLLSFYFQFPCILLTTIWLGTFQKLVWSEKTRRSNVRKSIILPLTIWNQVKTGGLGMTRKRLYFSFRDTKTICFVINKIFYSVYQCSRLHIHVQTVYNFVVINPPPKQRVCQLFVLYFCL